METTVFPDLQVKRQDDVGLREGDAVGGCGVRGFDYGGHESYGGGLDVDKLVRWGRMESVEKFRLGGDGSRSELECNVFEGCRGRWCINGFVAAGECVGSVAVHVRVDKVACAICELGGCQRLKKIAVREEGKILTR